MLIMPQKRDPGFPSLSCQLAASNSVHPLRRRGLGTWNTRAHGNTEGGKMRFGVELLRSEVSWSR